MKRRQLHFIGRILYVAGILVSLATFILHALPVNWGIFLSAACFVVGSFLFSGWSGANDGTGNSPQESGK